MNYTRSDLLERVARLRVYRRGERRAPHKPLLLLLAISRLLGGQRRLPYLEVEAVLLPLLRAVAPPVEGRHSPHNPYWYLQNDGFWEIENVASLERTPSGYPTMAAFRSAVGGLPRSLADWFVREPTFARAVMQHILDCYFPSTLHQDILTTVGYQDSPQMAADFAIAEIQVGQRRRVDSSFRNAVLAAYDNRCAFSGFRAQLAGADIGCEAAHVQWPAYSGPDVVANGLALEPTLHRLFDRGGWTLTDDRRILVSASFAGSDEAAQRIRSRHGQPLLDPLAGQPRIDLEYIRWHREPKLGGVFREPALPL